MHSQSDQVTKVSIFLVINSFIHQPCAEVLQKALEGQCEDATVHSLPIIYCKPPK